MRRNALLVLGLSAGLAASVLPARAMVGMLSKVPAATPSVVEVGYYCSPGFVASYGRCIATASTDEVDLYLNEPGDYDLEEAPAPVVRHRHRRHGLHERY